MRALPILLLLLAPLCGRCAITDQPAQSGAAGTYEQLQATCQTLMLAGPQGNIQALQPFYAATTNADIREGITAASGLFWMMCQRIADAERYAEHLRRNFPGSRYQFLLDKDANLIACSNCASSGTAQVPCTDCGGSGKCRACGGRGKVAGIVSGSTTLGAGPMLAGPSAVGTTSFRTPGVVGTAPTRLPGGVTGITRLGDPSTAVRRLDDPSALQPCSACGGSGACKTCKGTKLVRGRCPACQGFGTLFSPQTRLAFVDVLNHLRNLAFAAGMSEKGMLLVDGRWLARAAAVQLLERRGDERAEFARVAAEAERAKDYDTAFRLLAKVLSRHPDSTYTADVQRIQALLRAEAADKKLPEKSVRGPEQMAAAAGNPRREIGIIVEAVLDAARRGTNMPMLIAAQAAPALPARPVKWQAGEPELIDRTARVSVRIDRASRSGFLVAEPWEFRLVYENIQWKVWQVTGP